MSDLPPGRPRGLPGAVEVDGAVLDPPAVHRLDVCVVVVAGPVGERLPRCLRPPPSSRHGPRAPSAVGTMRHPLVQWRTPVSPVCPACRSTRYAVSSSRPLIVRWPTLKTASSANADTNRSPSRKSEPLKRSTSPQMPAGAEHRMRAPELVDLVGDVGRLDDQRVTLPPPARIPQPLRDAAVEDVEFGPRGRGQLPCRGKIHDALLRWSTLRTASSSSSARSSSVSTSRSANSSGRSKGVVVVFVQTPCRSGSPHGVRGACHPSPAAAAGCADAVPAESSAAFPIESATHVRRGHRAHPSAFRPEPRQL